MKGVRTPSSVITELSLLAGSLESVKRDIERGLKQGDDRFEKPWADHVCQRLMNIEGLLSDIRHGVALAPLGMEWE